jgi:hypothetical protein
MSDGGRIPKPEPPVPEGAAPAESPQMVPGAPQRDRSWPVTDPMRQVRAERSAASNQIARSLTAWRKENARQQSAYKVDIPESGGAPLGGETRGKMEKQLGADLSGVKVHTGGDSAKAADGLGARAFTVGQDVHFGAGEFSPGTKEGDRLLAHELTHTVQGARSGVQRKPTAVNDDAGLEHEADTMGAKAMQVSHPGEAAEVEADATADHAANALHGGGGGHGAAAHGGGAHDAHGGGEKAAAGGGAAAPAPTQAAPAVGAKLADGVQILRNPKPAASPAPAAAAGPAAPAAAAPAGPKKPANDAEYQALPGWADFLGNCSTIGVDKPMALGCWKSCMDQLFTNDEQVKKISGDRNAILAYVDSAAARAGFATFAEAMFQKFPLDMTKDYALWSGKNAYEFAKGAGCMALELTQIGSVFNNVTTAFSKNWNVMQGLWRAISDAYARKIAIIMGGKNIKVFHRKKGDIFAEVESKAVKEVTDKTKTKIGYEFHALLVPGIYNFEAGYDGLPNNDQARKDVTAAAKGDEKKAAAACAGQVKIFDYPAGAPAGAMQDLGAVVGNEDASLARLTPNNVDVTTKLDGIKKKLTTP